MSKQLLLQMTTGRWPIKMPVFFGKSQSQLEVPITGLSAVGLLPTTAIANVVVVLQKKLFVNLVM